MMIERALADLTGLRIAQFRRARKPLGRGLAKSHGPARLGRSQGGTLAGFCTAAGVIPFADGLTGLGGPPAGFRETAVSQPDLATLVVNNDAQDPALPHAARFGWPHDQDQTRREVVGPFAELRAAKEGFGDAGHWRAIWRASDHSRHGFGLIHHVTVCSDLHKRPLSGNPCYSARRSAVAMLTHSSSSEVRQTGFCARRYQ
jgi:hypothetical protein